MKVQKRIRKTIRSFFGSVLLKTISVHDLDESFKGDFCQFASLAESVATSEALTMPFFPEAAHLCSKNYYTPDIFTLNLHKIYFCPSYHLLYRNPSTIIEESISTQKETGQFDFREFRKRKVEKISGFCSSFRSYKNGYYHTLIDNLPRLYLLHHPNFRKIDSIKILCASSPTPLEQFYLDKLLPSNAEVLVIDPYRNYQIENFVFPSFLSRRFSAYLPSTYIKWFMDRVAPKRPRERKNRIYISRVATQKGRQRCILNETELWEKLKLHGFKKYVLETMSVEQQIELFYDAEFVIAAHGAGLANLIFADQAKVLELFATQFVIPHYYYLSKSLEHHYQFWCSNAERRHSNFEVDVSAILDLLILNQEKSVTFSG